jgi:diacylglycerol kinase (ATP)
VSTATPAGTPLQAGARLAFVVNPAARRGRDRDTIDAVARALRSRYTVDLVAPPTADDVERVVRAASSSHDAAVVAGGDGTVNRAACGLDGLAMPLGVIPMGTGNDFARGCGVPTAPLEAARRILEGRTRRLDLVRVNRRVFCTVGLLGVASDSAQSVARLGGPASRARGLMRLSGDWSYRIVGLAHLLAPRGATVRVRGTREPGEPGQPFEPVHAVFVANTRVLGGGLVLPIDADPSDGLLDIAVVPRMARVKLLWAFLCLAHGRPVPAGTLRVFRASRAHLECVQDVPFSADGDLMCRAARFDVEVMPGALILLV